MISGVREREIIQAACDCIENGGFTSLPISPKLIASSAGIGVMPWKPTKLGISGFLMRMGNDFGIGYSTAIANEGFINFTVGHELGHYFLDGHADALFAGGAQYHYSRSGFISDNNHEREADLFAAELLMPERFFKAVLGESGTGFAAIERVADIGRTSLVATAIRYTKLCDDPVAVILSNGPQIDWCFISKELRNCRGVYPLKQGSFLPTNTPTLPFNRQPMRVEGCDRTEGFCSLCDWFEGAPDVEMQEDVVGLGHYGKTLTVLFTEEVFNGDDEDDEDTEDYGTGLPSERWRRQDAHRYD